MKVRIIFTAVMILVLSSAAQAVFDGPDYLNCGYPRSDLRQGGMCYTGTPYFSGQNNLGRKADRVEIRLAFNCDPDFTKPVWQSGPIRMTELGTGMVAGVINGARVPDVFYGMGDPAIDLLQAGMRYVWQMRTGDQLGWSEWSDTAYIEMAPVGTQMIARFYPDQDTWYGDNTAREGRPTSRELQAGGWDAPTYAYLHFDLAQAPDFWAVESSRLCLYCVRSTVNDPGLAVARVTSDWNEDSVNADNFPDANAARDAMVKPTALKHTVVYVTDIITSFLNHEYLSYGLMLQSMAQNYPNRHTFAAREEPGLNNDSFLEIIYTNRMN